ncbi:MAG: hypothetical protein ABS879_02040, partial [Eubacteriales bacterium]
MITINIEENASPDGTERRIFSLQRVLYPKKAGLSNFFILHRAKIFYSSSRKEEGASHLARRGKNAEAFLNIV